MTAGGCRHYRTPDGSEIAIRADCEVVRIGPKVNGGPNDKVGGSLRTGRREGRYSQYRRAGVAMNSGLENVAANLRDRILFVDHLAVSLSSVELDLRWGPEEGRIALRFRELISVEFAPSSPGNPEEEWLDGADLGQSATLSDPIREQFRLGSWNIRDQTQLSTGFDRPVFCCSTSLPSNSNFPFQVRHCETDRCIVREMTQSVERRVLTVRVWIALISTVLLMLATPQPRLRVGGPVRCWPLG